MAISLNSISVRKRAQRPPKIITAGIGKIGKTTFAAGAPAPIFIPCEEGLDGLEGVSAFPQPQSWTDLKECLLTLINEPHEFNTVVVDSLDWTEPLIWDQVCIDHDIKNIEALSYGRGFLEALSYWRELIELLDRLRNEKNMIIILIAHTQLRKFTPPDAEPYDMWELKLHRKAGELFFEFADIAGFCFQESVQKKSGESFGKEIKHTVTTGRRFMYVGKSPSYCSGNRYNMPDKIELKWSALAQCLAPQKPPANPPAKTTQTQTTPTKTAKGN